MKMRVRKRGKGTAVLIGTALLIAALLGGCSRAVQEPVTAGAEESAEPGEKAGPGGTAEPGEKAKPRETAEPGETEKAAEAGEESAGVDAEGIIFGDGKIYERVRDLKDGQYDWASVLTDGDTVEDEDGCEHVDYNSQEKSFERLDGSETIDVRRWDNLLWSAGEYLIFEYNGTVHVSKSDDLYQPVLSYDIGSTHGIVTKVAGGYMVADDRADTVSFYDEEFRPVRRIDGYRCMENGITYRDGLMAVRNMETGLKGYMDEEGNVVIPCEYGENTDFCDGHASVLLDAEMVPYTEDGGTVAMFRAEGGRWMDIDTEGNISEK